MKANIFVADELENKVFHLSQALDSATKIIDKLEEENNNLKNMLSIFDMHMDDSDHNDADSRF
jgi:FtsZ-binding cell division protein ZapB